MKRVIFFVFLLSCGLWATPVFSQAAAAGPQQPAATKLPATQQPEATKPQAVSHSNGQVQNQGKSQAQTPSKAQPQTEQIGTPANLPPATSTSVAHGPGYMTPTELRTYLRKLWLTWYRVNDLVGQVHPKQWKTSPVVQESFGQSLRSLKTQLKLLEQWRSQFDKRPDSMYLAYETYATIGAVLPRLDGVTKGVAEHENQSMAVEYSQAENHLFDMQQKLQPYLEYLLRNQDELLQVTESNLAACQNTLNYAMHDVHGSARPMTNIAPKWRTKHKPIEKKRHKGDRKKK